MGGLFTTVNFFENPEEPQLITQIPGLSFFPTLSFLLFLACLLFPTIISKERNYLGSTFPFISDTGTLAPASCWFTVFLNLTAYSLIITGVIRYIETRQRLFMCEKKNKGHSSLASSFDLPIHYFCQKPPEIGMVIFW